MRVALLLLLLAAPTAAAWRVDADAPPAADAGLPFEVEACVEGPPGAAYAWKAHLTLDGRTLAGSPRYGPTRAVPPEGRACERVTLLPRDGQGDAALLVRVRPADGGRVASWQGVVHLQQGPSLPLRIVAVHGPPFAGVTLENAGDDAASLAGVTLAQGRRAWDAPPATLPPGGRAFLGPRAPPDAPLHLAVDAAPRAGNLTLRWWSRALDAFPVPRLDAGEVATPDGVLVAGRTSVRAAPMRVHGNVTAFVTPDAGAAPVLALVEGARREILLTGYTLTSEDVAAALARAAARGVAVRALLEGAPVGGVPEEEQRLLAALAEAGVDVRLLRAAADFPARYRTLHAKVLVVDEARVLVSTENLHASSYPVRAGATGSRGYGVIVEDAALARLFADVFRSDAAAWPDVQAPHALPPPRPLAVSLGAAAGPVHVARGALVVTPILSPDAPLALVDAMRDAARSLDVAMLLAEPAWGAGPNPFLDASLAAARRGVTVRILLDGSADPARSRAVAEALTAAARTEALPLEARVDDPTRTLHAKLVLIDGERAYVGSMNWGRAAATQNREAGLLFDAPEVAARFQESFEEDWRGEVAAAREVPGPGVAAAVMVALALRARPRPRGAHPRRG